MDRFFSGMRWKDGEYWGFWFRIYGYGLNITNRPLLFCQRNGYTKALIVGRIKISLLKPNSSPTK